MMETFLSIHQAEIIGTLSTFDRLIFKGHLLAFYPQGAMARFLSSQGVLLKDFGPYVAQVTAQVKAQAQAVAEAAGRPYQYLAHAATHAKGDSKEARARAIAARDGVTTGLICVLAAVEPCSSFEVRGNRASGKLEVQRAARKCLHFYFYYLDAELGFMHVRLQSWFPFTVQVYINGREWLAGQLDRRGVAYTRYDNTFTQIADLPRAQALCEQFAHRQWPRVLHALARRVNPVLATIRQAGFGSYYWVADQCEYATDVMFRDRAVLQTLAPDLMQYGLSAFSAEDLMRFLGRSLHGNFKGEVRRDLKRRPEGWRVRYWLKQNSLKMYDKWSVLRVETTINNPREFRVLRVVPDADGVRSRRWLPMGKGVANLWRYAQVAAQANARYLEALALAQPKGKAVAELDDLCRPRTVDAKRYSRFHPVSAEDTQVFAAVLAGAHALNGFRNKELQTHLYDAPPSSVEEARRRSARVSRLIAKLRGHGLITKVKGCRLYRATQRGMRLMAAALHCRNTEFPKAVLQM